MLLASHGFPEDVVIAGLLHDVLEDSPEFSAELVAFGADVYRWVLTVTDPLQDSGAKGPWLKRKAAYIEQVRNGAAEAKAVACADKIHNMESTWMATERGAESHLKRPLSVQAEYWRRVRDAFGVWRHPMLDRYDELLGLFATKMK